LKDAIKEKNANAFANIDAPELTLYLINIRADTELSKNVNERIKTITPAEALNPTDELSDLFSEAPAKKTVHILVRAPALASLGSKRKLNEDSELESADINRNLLFNPTERGSRAFTASLLVVDSILDATTSVPPFLDQLRANLKAKRSINDKQRV
jgi:hypothetical protein